MPVTDKPFKPAPTKFTPDPPIVPAGVDTSRISRRGILDDPAPDASMEPQPTGYEYRTEPVWQGHPTNCGCNDCVNGTVPFELRVQLRQEVSRQTVGDITHVYWSDGSMTWEKVV